MKKISIIMIALALVMGMGQCKKNEQTASNNDGEEIVLKVCMNNGSKLYFGEEINNLVAVNWNADDIVYVGVNGQCIGYVKCKSATVENPSEGQFVGYSSTIDLSLIPNPAEQVSYFEFFTLGAKTQNIIDGNPDYVEFSYADQSVDPAVISYGKADEPYSTNPEAVYHCKEFINQNALVVFTVSPATTAPITLQGVKNKATVKFNGQVVPSEETGTIKTFYSDGVGHNGNPAKRYAVIPRNQGPMTGNVTAPGFTGTFEIPNGAVVNGLINGTINLTAN